MGFILIGIASGAAAVLLFMMFFSFFQVEEGHCASVSAFGKAKRNEDGSLKLWGPGVYLKLPWEKVKTLSTMEKKIDLGEAGHAFQTMARDGTTLSLIASIRLKADENNAEAILYGLEHPQAQIKDFLSCALRSEIANFGDDIDPGDLFIQLRNRQAVLRKAFETAVEKELERTYGVTLLGLDLVDISPPQELAIALNSVQTARADCESMIARAHALREKKLFAAKKKLDIAQTEALAAELEMKTVGDKLQTLEKNSTLADYLERRKAEVYKQSKLSIVRL